jgi:cholesterol transport system auxiliary component
MIPRAVARLATIAVTAVALSGCVTLFPKTTPVPLYRFGAAIPPNAQPAPATFSVRSGGLGFDRAAAGDAILTASGGEVAYIKDARWVTPATQLFESAVRRAFDAQGGPARYLGPGEAGHADYLLRLDVLRFEARYEAGAAAAPTVVVRLHASLSRQSDLMLVGERVFDERAPAAANRVSAITDAYDQATTKVLTDLVTWVDQTGH